MPPELTITRRRALQLASAALASGAVAGCGKDSDAAAHDTAAPVGVDPAPALWIPDEPLADDAFPLGASVGDPWPTEAVAWTRYDGDGPLQVIRATWDGGAWVETGREDATTADGGYTHAAVAGAPGWNAVAFVGPEGRSASARWYAPPASGDEVCVFGGTSCSKPEYAPYPALTAASADTFHFFLLGGDTVYTDSSTLEGYREDWAETLATQGYQDLLASASMIATWDDHEVVNNWGTEDDDPDRVAAGIQAFYEHLPVRGGPGEPLYRSFRWGDTIELFVLDGRSERDSSIGQYLSPEQLQWLIDGVTGSDAAFKLILNSVPITDFSPIIGTAQAEDRWQGFPEQRQALIDALAGISNVYFLGGDFHLGMVARVDATGPGADMYEILMGPAGNTGNPIALYEPDDQFLYLTEARNVTRFIADPAAGTLRVEFFGEDGALIEEITLPR